MADNPETSDVGQPSGPADPTDSGLSDQYEDLFQIVFDRVLELAAGVCRAVSARPMLATAAAAAVVGAAAGSALARRRTSRPEPMPGRTKGRTPLSRDPANRVAKSGKRLGRAGDYGELVQLGLKLLENPIVRAVLIENLRKRVTKRFK